MLLCISTLNKRNNFNTTHICILYIFCKESDWQNQNYKIYLQLRKVIDMIQKIIDSNIDKNTEKEAEEIFYSESNMKYLEKVIADIELGKVKLVEHDLIEE